MYMGNYCSCCGASLRAEDSFCSNCGAKANKEPPSISIKNAIQTNCTPYTPLKTLHCPKCEGPNEYKNTRCIFCGTSLVKAKQKLEKDFLNRIESGEPINSEASFDAYALCDGIDVIDERIEKFGKMALQAGCTEKELRKTRLGIEAVAENIDPDETVFYCMATGTVNGICLYMDWSFLVVTNKRVFFAGKEGGFKSTILTASVELTKIEAVNTETLWGVYSMIVTTADGPRRFDGIGCSKPIGADLINGFTAAIRKARDSVSSSSRISVADEILKLKQLLDMGAISVKEYNDAKRKLLR